MSHHLNVANVLLAPLVSEKVVTMKNVVSFWVLPKADKASIKNAVETMFDVKVEDVRTVVKPVRPRRGSKAFTKRRQFKKKAYVQLVEGQELNLSFEQ
ncbi:MAG: 50S ribosomal protein L23 [Legionellales bacterium]|nr:50S ribosomal protein L23 [Legionellales bacterium]|tara:strand:- start:256 stop:549 length:294 start_codon:yes stop_codon:yes gene_type:complete